MSLDNHSLYEKILKLQKQVGYKQIKFSNGPLSGVANCCFVLGIDYNTGDLFYRDSEGNWQLINESGGSGIESIIAGVGINVNSTDPLNPIVSATGIGTPTFDSTIDFSINANPNTGGTTFNPNTPNLTTVIYVSTIDGSQWTSNGSTYTLYIAPYWSKTGNSGTTSVNFLGTTDNQDLRFKRNNILSGLISSSNTGFGNSTLTVNTASSTTALGSNALKLNTSGVFNTAVGASTLQSNVTGGRNTAVGFGVLGNNTNTANTGVGSQVLGSNTSGQNNTAIGNVALSTNITGSYNVAIGSNSMTNQTSGDNNTVIGYQALDASNGASNNIALGFDAGKYNSSTSNQIFINSLDRGNYSGDRTLSPIYIQQNATVGSQLLTFNGQSGFNTIAPTSTIDITANALGITPSNSKGIVLSNNTLAASGAQQISPYLRFLGHAFKSGIGSGDRSIETKIYLLPVQGNQPSGIMKFVWATNGGSDIDMLGLTTFGAIIDSTGSVGNNGDVLTSNGTGLNSAWKPPSTTTSNWDSVLAQGGTFTNDYVADIGTYSFSLASTTFPTKLFRISNDGLWYIGNSPDRLTNFINNDGTDINYYAIGRHYFEGDRLTFNNTVAGGSGVYLSDEPGNQGLHNSNADQPIAINNLSSNLYIYANQAYIYDSNFGFHYFDSDDGISPNSRLYLTKDAYGTGDAGLFSSVGDEFIAVWNESNDQYKYSNGAYTYDNPSTTHSFNGNIEGDSGLRLSYAKIHLENPGISNYNILITDYTVSIDNGADSVTVVLPDPTGIVGKLYVIKRFDDSSTGTITISSVVGNVQDIISNAFTPTTTLVSLGYGTAQRFQSNGSNWEILT